MSGTTSSAWAIVVIAALAVPIGSGCGDDEDTVAGTGGSSTGGGTTSTTSGTGGSQGGTGGGSAGSGGALSLELWQRHVLDDARPSAAVFIAGGDLDEDGDTDVVTGAWWYENPGDNAGTWQRADIGSPLNNLAAVHDFDGDGHLDLLGTEGSGASANADFAFALGDGGGALPRRWRRLSCGQRLGGHGRR